MDLIQLNEPLAYNLYVNASSNESRLNFIRIFPMGDSLTIDDVENFRRKYPRLYVAEGDRDNYLKTLVQNGSYSPEQKSEAIKDSAIQHLDNLFNSDKEFTTEVLNDAIEGCRGTVESMIEVINDFDIKKLQDHISKLSFHDFYTYDHSINVSMYCISIFKIVNPNAKRGAMVTAGLGGMLHDLGKINIPTHILNKPDKLDEEEFAIIKEHPTRGEKLLQQDEVEMPDEVDPETIRRIVLEHHENYDGTGYPMGKKGSAIHVMARITAIADFFDAITTKRSYHEPISIEEAVAVMRSTVNKKIDPNLFELFATHVGKISENMPNKVFSIDPNFDACMPHRDLPIQSETRESETIDTNPDDYGGIKQVETKRPPPSQTKTKKPIKVKVSKKFLKKKWRHVAPVDIPP